MCSIFPIGLSLSFLAEALNCDIDDPAYAVNGRSKGKRLRSFLQTVDIPTVVRALKAFWEYREAVRAIYQQRETVENAEGRLLALINRLVGKPEPDKPADQAPVHALDRPRLVQLKPKLLAPHQLAPQARGVNQRRKLSTFQRPILSTFEGR